jgi:hypothetical protein
MSPLAVAGTEALSALHLVASGTARIEIMQILP